MSLHPHASAAINAAKNYRKWGAWAARRYCQRRGVPLRLLTLARVLEAGRLAGV